MFGDKTNLDDWGFAGCPPGLLGEPLEKHGLAVAARSVEVCQTGTLLTGAKPVHDIQQRALDAFAAAHVVGQQPGARLEGVHRHRIRHGQAIILRPGPHRIDGR